MGLARASSTDKITIIANYARAKRTEVLQRHANRGVQYPLSAAPGRQLSLRTIGSIKGEHDRARSHLKRISSRANFEICRTKDAAVAYEREQLCVGDGLHIGVEQIIDQTYQ